MPANPAVRVGILVFIALVAFVAVVLFLTGYRMRMAGYPIFVVFDDAQGLTQGAEVRMAGVTIGVLDKVTLDPRQRALMRLLINHKYQIPAGSKFTLRIGMLIGDKYIEIQPKRGAAQYYQPQDRLVGEVPTRIEDLVPKTRKVLNSLQATADNLNSILGDKTFKAHLGKSLENLEHATAQVDKTMSVFRMTAVSQKESVRAIIRNVQTASESLRVFTGELARFTKKGDMQANLSATLAAARKASESLERSTASLETLMTSPSLQEDVRQTIKEARGSVEQAHKVMNRVSGFLGVEGGDTVKLGPKISFRQPTLEAFFRPTDSRLRVNAYATIPMRGKNFLRLGIYDLGETNKGILQPGMSLNTTTDFRYGIYASRLGVGLDYAFSPRMFGSANLYDPNRATFDVQAGYKMNDNWGLQIGIDKVFRENQFIFGARLTK